jgi:hypothetical protein
VLLVEDPPPPPEPTVARPASTTAASAPALEPAAAAGQSLTFDLLREDISAHIDGELHGDLARRFDAHVAACVACDAEVWVFDQQRARVRALPRLQPHDLFVRQLMAKLEAEELADADQARRLAEQRAQRWKALGWGLRAAGLLVAAALSFHVTGPEDLPEGRLPQLQPSGRYTQQPRDRRDEVTDRVAQFVPPLKGPFDVTLELHAPHDIDAALRTATELARSLRARVGETRTTEAQRELELHIAANLLDDYYLRCDQTAEVDGTPEAARLVEEASTEQDRVVLKTGIVLAGQVVAENARQVDIVAAGMRQTIRRDRIERIVRATEARRVRIVLRSDAR